MKSESAHMPHTCRACGSAGHTSSNFSCPRRGAVDPYPGHVELLVSGPHIDRVIVHVLERFPGWKLVPDPGPLAYLDPWNSIRVMVRGRYVCSVLWPVDAVRSDSWYSVTAERLAESARTAMTDTFGAQSGLPELHREHRNDLFGPQGSGPNMKRTRTRVNGRTTSSEMDPNLEVDGVPGEQAEARTDEEGTDVLHPL